MATDILTPDALRGRFAAHGLKFTGQRYAVYRALAVSREHPSADALLAAVRRQHPSLSINTVYKTIEALRAIGIASEVAPRRDRARFDADPTPHHHLVCLGCHRIEDLYDSALDRLALAQSMRAGYRITGHRVEFQGYCTDCQKHTHGGDHAKTRSKK
jgi:Fur family peroxide stress response transcriptional regulator